MTAIYNGSGDSCEVYTYTTRRGTYYVCDGGTIVNLTNDEITEGCDLTEINDFDCFTVSQPITSEDMLEEAVRS